MVFKTILIEDELLALERLKKLLKHYNDIIDIVNVATNGAEAIEQIDSLKPDLIFLDIQMPEFNGFEVLARIQHQPIVIFSTAYDEFALKAFETNSIDYLLKPISSKRLAKAIEKLHKLSGEKQDEFSRQLQKMMELIKKPVAKRMLVKIGDIIKPLNFNEIYFFTADDKYVRVNTFDKSYLIDKSLSKLESELDESFIRIHRATIVNSDHIGEIIRMFKGSFEVRMKDKKRTKLQVSRLSKSKLGLS